MDKMLVAINTLIEYLNQSYIHDEKIEMEVEEMIKAFINSEMIKQGFE